VRRSVPLSITQHASVLSAFEPLTGFIFPLTTKASGGITLVEAQDDHAAPSSTNAQSTTALTIPDLYAVRAVLLGAVLLIVFAVEKLLVERLLMSFCFYTAVVACETMTCVHPFANNTIAL
jgi:hypothetical protein